MPRRSSRTKIKHLPKIASRATSTASSHTAAASAASSFSPICPQNTTFVGEDVKHAEDGVFCNESPGFVTNDLCKGVEKDLGAVIFSNQRAIVGKKLINLANEHQILTHNQRAGPEGRVGGRDRRGPADGGRQAGAAAASRPSAAWGVLGLRRRDAGYDGPSNRTEAPCTSSP